MALCTESDLLLHEVHRLLDLDVSTSLTRIDHHRKLELAILAYEDAVCDLVSERKRPTPADCGPPPTVHPTQTDSMEVDSLEINHSYESSPDPDEDQSRIGLRQQTFEDVKDAQGVRARTSHARGEITLVTEALNSSSETNDIINLKDMIKTNRVPAAGIFNEGPSARIIKRLRGPTSGDPTEIINLVKLSPIQCSVPVKNIINIHFARVYRVLEKRRRFEEDRKSLQFDPSPGEVSWGRKCQACVIRRLLNKDGVAEMCEPGCKHELRLKQVLSDLSPTLLSSLSFVGTNRLPTSQSTPTLVVLSTVLSPFSEEEEEELNVIDSENYSEDVLATIDRASRERQARETLTPSESTPSTSPCSVILDRNPSSQSLCGPFSYEDSLDASDSDKNESERGSLKGEDDISDQEITPRDTAKAASVNDSGIPTCSKTPNTECETAFYEKSERHSTLEEVPVYRALVRDDVISNEHTSSEILGVPVPSPLPSSGSPNSVVTRVEANRLPVESLSNRSPLPKVHDLGLPSTEAAETPETIEPNVPYIAQRHFPLNETYSLPQGRLRNMVQLGSHISVSGNLRQPPLTRTSPSWLNRGLGSATNVNTATPQNGLRKTYDLRNDRQERTKFQPISPFLRSRDSTEITTEKASSKNKESSYCEEGLFVQGTGANLVCSPRNYTRRTTQDVGYIHQYPTKRVRQTSDLVLPDKGQSKSEGTREDCALRENTQDGSRRENLPPIAMSDRRVTYLIRVGTKTEQNLTQGSGGNEKKPRDCVIEP